jgi:hypothetical protein
MGFTIGGIREIRERRRLPRLGGRSVEAAAVTAVAEYTGLWGWDVLPGTRARRGPGGRAECSCGSAGCPAPGAHPLDHRLLIPAGATLGRAAADWARTPGAAVLLPTGGAFDVIEVPAAAGEPALLRMERLGLQPGPVAAAPRGPVWFFVAPGTAARLPQLLYRMGWDGARLELRALGTGRQVTAPPSDHGGHGPVRWLRAPDLETAARPPAARLLLGTLAYACHRTRGG